jgi:transcriptional regulator with XRE-family HTH domain
MALGKAESGPIPCWSLRDSAPRGIGPSANGDPSRCTAPVPPRGRAKSVATPCSTAELAKVSGSGDMSLDTPGERIKWALVQRGISAAQLGRHLGVTRGAVSQWWGKHGPASPHKKIQQISDYLNLRLDWLITGRGEPLRENCEIADSYESSSTNPVDIIGARLVGVAEAKVQSLQRPPSIPPYPRSISFRRARSLTGSRTRDSRRSRARPECNGVFSTR